MLVSWVVMIGKNKPQNRWRSGKDKLNIIEHINIFLCLLVLIPESTVVCYKRNPLHLSNFIFLLVPSTEEKNGKKCFRD